MDRGIWITFYDLPEAGRDAYLSWAHETYIPQLLKRPGYLWAAHYATVDKSARKTGARDTRNTVEDPAVPRGGQYLLIVGGEDADVFGKPVPSKLHAHLPAADGTSLARGEYLEVIATKR